MTEIEAAKRWLHATLKASSTLCALIGGSSAPRIYDTMPPQTTPAAALPYVIYQLQTPGNDLATVSTTRIWASGLYLVRGIAEWPYTNLDAIAEALDGALHGKSGTVSDGTVYACVRERPFELNDYEEGLQIRQLGGLYRILSRGG